MMKKVVVAGPDAAPVVLAMQAKLRDEIGVEKFEEMRRGYLKG